MGSPSAQFFLVDVLRRSQLLLIEFGAPKPTFGQANPSRDAPGVRKRPGHILALGGVSAKFLRGDHRTILSSRNPHQRRAANIQMVSSQYRTQTRHLRIGSHDVQFFMAAIMMAARAVAATNPTY